MIFMSLFLHSIGDIEWGQILKNENKLMGLKNKYKITMFVSLFEISCLHYFRVERRCH